MPIYDTEMFRLPNLFAKVPTIWYIVHLPPLLFRLHCFILHPIFPSFFLCRLVSQVINMLTGSVSLLAMWETRKDVLYDKYMNAQHTLNGMIIIIIMNSIQ